LISKVKSNWISQKGYLPKDAKIIKYVLEYKGELLEIDEWMPFPQDGTTYTFGDKDDPGDDGRPLPIGVLIYLWEHWDRITGNCPYCNGDVYGFRFGGFLSSGTMFGCCLECYHKLTRSTSGLAFTAQEITKVLEPTKYRIKKMGFGHSFAGPLQSLYAALRQLGVKDI